MFPLVIQLEMLDVILKWIYYIFRRNYWGQPIMSLKSNIYLAQTVSCRARMIASQWAKCWHQYGSIFKLHYGVSELDSICYSVHAISVITLGNQGKGYKNTFALQFTSIILLTSFFFESAQNINWHQISKSVWDRLGPNMKHMVFKTQTNPAHVRMVICLKYTINLWHYPEIDPIINQFLWQISIKKEERRRGEKNTHYHPI